MCGLQFHFGGGGMGGGMGGFQMGGMHGGRFILTWCPRHRVVTLGVVQEAAAAAAGPKAGT